MEVIRRIAVEHDLGNSLDWKGGIKFYCHWNCGKILPYSRCQRKSLKARLPAFEEEHQDKICWNDTAGSYFVKQKYWEPDVSDSERSEPFRRFQVIIIDYIINVFTGSRVRRERLWRVVRWFLFISPHIMESYCKAKSGRVRRKKYYVSTSTDFSGLR